MIEQTMASPTKEGRPGDRPPGAPRAAMPAFASYFFLQLVVPNAIVMLSGAFLLGDGIGLFLPSMPILLVGETAVLVPIAWGFSKGKLWAVRLFRPVAWVLAILHPPLLLLAALGAFGIIPMANLQATGSAVVMGVMLALVSPGPFLIAYGLRHVRWLDPASTPDEWELPYMQDPATLNPVRKGPVPTWMAIVLPPLALYRLGLTGFAALTAFICVIALPALLFSPPRGLLLWLLSMGLALGSLGSRRPPNTEP
jgi:hypothetical protein